MGYANCIVVNSTPENREVVAEAGHFYAKNDLRELSEKFSALIRDRDLVLRTRRISYARACEQFSWEQICGEYEKLFSALISGRK